MARKTKQYEVLIACRNDKSGKVFEPGDTVKSGDFVKAVIDNWLEIGVLKEVDDGGDN